MKEKRRFDSEDEAREYLKDHGLVGRVVEPVAGTRKWALNFPIEAHVTVHQPHSPTPINFLSPTTKTEE